MSADPRGKRLTKEQREAIIRDLRAAKKSMRSISVDHSVSISTVSKIAAELGLSSPRKRSKPVQPPDHSYDKSRRIAVLDMMLKGIEDQIRAGGLNSKQLFDLARSARELTTSRRGEDQLPDALEGQETSLRKGEADYATLVSLRPNGTPRNIAALFALRDLEIARDAGDAEGEESAKDRVRAACVEAGLSPINVPFDQMISVASQGSAGSSASDQKYGSGTLEYQGEGLA